MGDPRDSGRQACRALCFLVREEEETDEDEIEEDEEEEDVFTM